jgi:hypothetical protein
VKVLLPSGNVLIVNPPPKAIHIPTTPYPRASGGFSPLNGHASSTHGLVIYLVAKYTSASPVYYILEYHTTPARASFWGYIEANFIAPPADRVAEGWTVNFYFKGVVIDKLTSAQFNAL